MNVSELIEELQACRGDEPVYIYDGNTFYGIDFNTGTVEDKWCVRLHITDREDDDDA